MVNSKQYFNLMIIFVGGCLFWQAIVVLFTVPDYLLPSPIHVFGALMQQYHVILTNAKSTIIETLIGLLLGGALGMLSALVIAYYKPLRQWMLPVLLISQALPTFAIAPLLVVWFGYGLASKIATIMIVLYFPVATAFYDGLRHTQQSWIELANVMNAPQRRILLYISVPAALPNLASGLRIATAMAPIAAVVSEWVGSSQGLGFLMMNANARLQIDLMFAALFCVTVFSLLLYFSIDYGLRRLMPWVSHQH